MAETCKNCAHEITLNFCPSCGQKKMKRIDGKYLKDELEYTLIHTNKGFFHTCKKLMRQPGLTVNEFIAGNRVNYYKPIALVFVLTGISAFLTHILLDPRFFLQGQKISAEDMETYMKAYEGMLKYNSFIMVASIPLMSFFSWLAFRKWGYNYFEHIVINAFYVSIQLIATIFVIIPLQFISQQTGLSLFTVIAIQYLLVLGLWFWFAAKLYADRSFWSVFGRSLLFFGLTLMFFAMVSILVGIVMAIIGLTSAP